MCLTGAISNYYVDDRITTFCISWTRPCSKQAAMAGQDSQPAFTLSLNFDPTGLLAQTSADQDFDKILEELDLELAGNNTDQLVQHITQGPSAPNGLSSAGSDAGGLRKLFGIQPGFALQQSQQPEQAQQAAVQQVAQQQQQHNGQPMQQAQPADMQQLLLQQQQLLIQQQLQQQQAQGLGVVYQLPSPFMQPLSTLTAGLPMQGLPMHTIMQPGALNSQMLPAQQWLLNAAEPGGPMFTFSALPSAGQTQQMQQPGLSVSLPPAAVSAGSAPSLFVGPGAWPYMQNGTVAAMPDPSAATNSANPVGQLSSEAGAIAAGVGAVAGAAAQRRGRGRGRSAAPPVPGAEKPKGPSQKFRQRQKATISNLEAELTQKLAELQMLSEENEMLKLRSEVLEAVTSGREYQEKLIQEHGPPTFDVAETSPHSNHNSGSLSRWGSGKSHAAAATGSDSDPTQVGIAATIGPRSGSNSSVATGGVTAGPAVATAAGAAGHDGSSPSGAGAGAAGAEGAGDGGACPADLLLCAEDEECTVDVQQRSIRWLRQMSADEIIMHWKQFLRDVSAELLTAEEKEEQQRLDVVVLGREGSCKGPQAQRQDSEAAASDDSAFIMSSVCRWCGRTNTEGLHLETGCSTAQQQQQQQGGQQQAQQDPATSTATAAVASPGSSSAEQRMAELVKKYSYMTKFVALLNPGAMDSLFGRNLDTGEAVPYNDEHWRNVVARLHLTKTQVAYLTACAELYFSSLCPLMQERKVLQEALMQADGALSECTRRLLGADSGLDQLALLDRLSSNLKKEYVLRVICNCHVWGRVLTAVQFAKSAVYSHPFIPDVHAMVCVLYEDTTGKKPDCYDGKVFQHRIAAAKAALAKAKAVQQAAVAGQPVPAVDGSNVLASGWPSRQCGSS